MQERQKLDEARFFLQLLHSNREAPIEYRYYLSAFLCAGRSVLQYAIEENQRTVLRNGKPAKVWASTQVQNWFEGWAADPIIDFFKDLRDDNIHVLPVEPDRKRAVMMGNPGAIKFKAVTPGDRSLEVEAFVPSSPMGEPFTFRIAFSNWSGPEDTTMLCERYVNRLEDFINDGTRRGFLKKP